MRRFSLPMRSTPLAHALSLAFGVSCLVRVAPAVAGCDRTAPQSNQTATCDTRSPNPSNVSVIAVPGSVNVTINVLTGVELDIAGNGLFVRNTSTATNEGTLQITGDGSDAMTSQSATTGRNTLVNRGAIFTVGMNSEAMFNNAAAVTMRNEAGGTLTTSGASASAMNDFASPGGGTLVNDGAIATSGAGSHGMAARTSGDLAETRKITRFPE